MISVILGVGIPILYLAIGSAVGIKVWDFRPDKDCRITEHSSHCKHMDGWHGQSCYCDFEKVSNGKHSKHHTCDMSAAFSGLFWPFAGVFLVVWVLMKGTKQPKGTRIGRAQRRVRKMQARIDELQRDLGMEP
jgi:hypothetical protein